MHGMCSEFTSSKREVLFVCLCICLFFKISFLILTSAFLMIEICLDIPTFIANQVVLSIPRMVVWPTKESKVIVFITCVKKISVLAGNNVVIIVC